MAMSGQCSANHPIMSRAYLKYSRIETELEGAGVGAAVGVVGRVGTWTGGRVGSLTGGRVGSWTGGRVGIWIGGRVGI
jgi:hypothetical protein